MIDINLAEFIKRNRRAEKMSQLDLSKGAGLSQGYISRLERGLQSVCWPEAIKVLSVLGFTVSIQKNKGDQ